MRHLALTFLMLLVGGFNGSPDASASQERGLNGKEIIELLVGRLWPRDGAGAVEAWLVHSDGKLEIKTEGEATAGTILGWQIQGDAFCSYNLDDPLERVCYHVSVTTDEFLILSPQVDDADTEHLIFGQARRWLDEPADIRAAIADQLLWHARSPYPEEEAWHFSPDGVLIKNVGVGINVPRSLWRISHPHHRLCIKDDATEACYDVQRLGKDRLLLTGGSGEDIWLRIP